MKKVRLFPLIVPLVLLLACSRQEAEPPEPDGQTPAESPRSALPQPAYVEPKPTGASASLMVGAWVPQFSEWQRRNAELANTPLPRVLLTCKSDGTFEMVGTDAAGKKTVVEGNWKVVDGVVTITATKIDGTKPTANQSEPLKASLSPDGNTFTDTDGGIWVKQKQSSR